MYHHFHIFAWSGFRLFGIFIQTLGSFRRSTTLSKLKFARAEVEDLLPSQRSGGQCLVCRYFGDWQALCREASVAHKLAYWCSFDQWEFIRIDRLSWTFGLVLFRLSSVLPFVIQYLRRCMYLARCSQIQFLCIWIKSHWWVLYGRNASVTVYVCYPRVY